MCAQCRVVTEETVDEGGIWADLESFVVSQYNRPSHTHTWANATVEHIYTHKETKNKKQCIFDVILKSQLSAKKCKTIKNIMLTMCIRADIMSSGSST